METTARDIIQGAFEELQIYAPGEQMLDADAARALNQLDDMLDSWSNESLSCFATLTQSLTLVPGVQQYTIGPGGAVNGPRPLRLIESSGGAYIMDTNGTRYPLDVVPQTTWNQITLSTINSAIPDTLFYDPQFPLGVLNFYPVPNTGGYTASWTSYLQLVSFGGLSSLVSLPLGYKEALRLNLAIALLPIYPTGTLSQVTIERAAKAKRNIKVTNQRDIIAVFDAELIARSGTATLSDFYRGGR